MYPPNINQMNPQQTIPNFRAVILNNNNPNIPNMHTENNPIQPNQNSFDGKPNASFSLLPNNQSGGNALNPLQNHNVNPNVPQQPAINFPSHFGNNNNNIIIPPMNNSSNEKSFYSMPEGNSSFPVGKSDGFSMMSGGFPPNVSNIGLNNTFPQTKLEGNNDGFPSMGAMATNPNNAAKSFPNINSPNFSSMDDLEFPSSDPKKK
jgi:hypothetical protein